MRILLAVFFALALLPPVEAQECVPSTSTSNEDMTVVELPAGGLCHTVCYVVVDHDPGSECSVGAWVYPEANGHPGLQRSDECHDDTCGGMTEADVTLW